MADRMAIDCCFTLDPCEDQSVNSVGCPLEDRERIMGIDQASAIEIGALIQERMDQGNLKHSI